MDRVTLDERFTAGERAQLVAGYQELAAVEARDVGVFQRLGICLHDSGQHEPALEAFRTVMRLGPTTDIARIVKRRILRIEARPDPSAPRGRKRAVAAGGKAKVAKPK